MKKTELVTFLEDVIERLEIKRLSTFLTQYLEDEDKISVQERHNFTMILKQSVEVYGVLSEIEQQDKVLRAIDLEKIYSSSNIENIVNAVTLNLDSRKKTEPRYNSVHITLNTFLNVTTLHKQLVKLFFDSINDKISRTERVLSIDILDEDIGGVGSTRFIKVFSDIDELYRVICALMGTRDQKLSVYRIESGSTFRAWFKGNRKPIDVLKLFVIERWEQVFYPTQSTFDRNMSSFEKGLNIMELIAEKEKSHALTKKQAEKSRDKIYSLMDSLINCGIVPIKGKTPEHKDVDYQSLTYEAEMRKIEHKNNEIQTSTYEDEMKKIEHKPIAEDES